MFRLTRPTASKARSIACLGITAVLMAGSQATTAQTETAAATIPAMISSEIDVKSNGDAIGRIVFDLQDEHYVLLKSTLSDAGILVRDLKSTRAEAAYDESKTQCRYDDAMSAVIMELHQIGAATNHGDGRWSYDIEEMSEFVNMGDTADDRRSAFFIVDHAIEGLHLVGHAEVALPAGASNCRWNDADGTLEYQLDYRQVAEADARLGVDFDARDQLMSALYKMYGLGSDLSTPWVAKSVLSNDGDAVIRDLRVRYRVQGYADWSVWQRFPELVPGQSVMSVYYPVLDRSIAELRTSTPANVVVEWEYRDASGAVVADSTGERIVVLGVREFVFSDLETHETRGDWLDLNTNAPLIAAWVSQDDPVVTEFASMANKLAGGQGAPYSDDAAIAVLRSCYDLMIRNDFTYQGPVGFDYANLNSFDNRLVQRIKFPRDVIKDRSGTCIELACLYASMAHAVGLKPYIALVPGHAFCVIELPSGDILPVETTGIRGGLQDTAVDFEGVVRVGRAILDENEKNETLISIDVRDLWTRGMANPELPALPADILQSWNVTVDGVVAVNAPQRPAHGGSNVSSYNEASIEGVSERATRLRRLRDVMATQTSRAGL